jgi:hypothetical protein
LWIAKNQRTTIVNVYQDFVATIHTNFFQGHMDRDLTILEKFGYPIKKKKKGMIKAYVHWQNVLCENTYYSKST